MPRKRMSIYFGCGPLTVTVTTRTTFDHRKGIIYDLEVNIGVFKNRGTPNHPF